MENAEIVLAAYGISARISKSAVDACRAMGIRAGLLRAMTLYPFPNKAFDEIDYERCRGLLVVEMSIPPQFAEDVAAAVRKRCPIHTCVRSAGNVIEKGRIVQAVMDMAGKQEVV